MPYWTSRVGAVPQGHDSKAMRSRNRNQGISLEDLKKQTAMRLAHEHHKTQRFPAEPGVVAETRATPESSQSAAPYCPYRLHEDAYSNERSSYQYAQYAPAEANSEQASLHSAGSSAPSFAVHTSSHAASKNARTATKKSKLPHGLTVQELKEMTKARLQAEAADKRDVKDIPAMVTAGEHRLQPSPIPTGFYSHRANGSPYPETGDLRDRTRSIDSRPDLWDNASVSTANSDYQVSEFSGNINADDHSSTSFGRNRSPPGQAFYNHSNEYNRRRAATYSPRGCLSLQEDRPLVPGQNFARIPAFTTPTRRPVPSRPQYVTQSYPNTLGHVDDNEGNRNRTFSTPALSHTAEEFDFFESVRQEQAGMAVTGLADVFRDSSRMLDSSSLLNSHTMSPETTLTFGDLRSRAATWSEPSNSLFGPIEGQLTDDLASILNLSGAEGKRRPPGL